MGSVPEETEIIFGDSRNMSELKDESIHLASPPLTLRGG